MALNGARDRATAKGTGVKERNSGRAWTHVLLRSFCGFYMGFFLIPPLLPVIYEQ